MLGGYVNFPQLCAYLCSAFSNCFCGISALDDFCFYEFRLELCSIHPYMLFVARHILHK